MQTGAMPAVQIAAKVRAGQLGPVDVVRSCLARIAARDPEIGAFAVVMADPAMAEAQAVAGRPDLDRLPLAGVPVAVKDNVAVAGQPTRYGSAATHTDPAPADDELVRRLRAAGAIVVGKTRLPELAIWGFTESRAFGATRNPRDLTRNAGGSTGGGAAAVAAGMVPLALGSDGGGSLRIPAANCTVVGLKPGRGVVPLAGGVAEHWYGCTEFGPIAATVADAALALDVLASGDRWRDPRPPSGPLRVAVSARSPSPLGRPAPVVRAALRRATDLLRQAGHQIVDSGPPYPLALVNIWVRRWLAGVASEVDHLGLPIEALEPRTRTMVAKGRRLRQRGLPRRSDADAWLDKLGDWFANFDVLLTPTIAQPAPPAGWAATVGYWRGYVNGARTVPYTQAWNVAGFPALSLPMGLAPAAAVQLVAPAGREDSVLAVACQLEAAAAGDRA